MKKSHDFKFDGVMKMARVILKGDATEVLRLINDYNSINARVELSNIKNARTKMNMTQMLH